MKANLVYCFRDQSDCLFIDRNNIRTFSKVTWKKNLLYTFIKCIGYNVFYANWRTAFRKIIAHAIVTGDFCFEFVNTLCPTPLDNFIIRPSCYLVSQFEAKEKNADMGPLRS